MGKPVFVPGIGAQKAGASFVHASLDAHPDAALGDPKEMHVFNAVFLPELCGESHGRRREALARLRADEPVPRAATGRGKPPRSCGTC